ncbi:MAG: L-serine ammonia-lyase [Clostridia bacterium]|nr:L-serine ammonia-lyase [Clostridia bacterium]
MQTLKELYKTGRGPSSSHTMGPERAAKLFSARYPDADRFVAVLYGSLSKTGAGHGTDRVIRETFAPRETEVVFSDDPGPFAHENTFDLTAYRSGDVLGTLRVYSVGGGTIRVEGEAEHTPEIRYSENTFHEIAELCKHRGIRLSDYVFENEDADFHAYLHDIWQTMKLAVQQGLTTSGVLPGGLHVERKAQFLFNQRHIDESPSTRENRIVCAYAFAVSEQNADGGVIVTAPTCGACGVLPAVLKYMQEKNAFTDEDVIRALAVGGLIGNLVKTNASISGAECGCQAEIGTACSMASAALCELHEMSLDQIEYAAEVALEHHLGLTCDPICGLVQIPCIERNAVAAMRAINALSLANFLSETRKISFDMVVRTMYETGRDLNFRYRETSAGGLAKIYQ